jgi:hypothetical protein
MKNIIETLDNLNWKKINHPEINNMEISEYGHCRRIGSKIIRLGTHDNNGYRSIKIGLGGGLGSKKYLIHRLVAMTFHPEYYIEGLVVDHRDENKLNNHYSNLQFISRKANIQKSFKHRKDTFMNRKLTTKEVVKCRKLYSQGVSIWDIWDLILNKKIAYASVMALVHNKTYKEVV